MADQSRVLKNVAFDLYFHIYKNDGTVIANPGGLAGRTVCAAHTAGAATDAAPSCVDTTGGACLVVLSQAEMNSDYVEVKATSTDTGAVAFTCTLYPTPVGMTGDAFAAIGDVHATDLPAVMTMLTDIHATDLPAVKTDTVLLVKGRFNKVISDPATGHETVYDDNSTTPLRSGDIYEDIAGTMPFDGSGANRRDRMT